MPRRREYKFLIPVGALADLRATLRPYVVLDQFSEARPEKCYTVRSVYYDTRQFTAYEEKLEGFRIKRKLRIRGYDQPNDRSMVFLEIKRREDDFIGKSRAPVPWSRLRAVFGGYGPRAAALPFPPGSDAAVAAGRFLFHYYRLRLLPVVLVAYEREAFYSRFDSKLRLTFDRNVRSRLYPTLDSLYLDRDAKFTMPGHFVFEVKFYGCLPQWVRMAVSRFGLVRVAVSKFARGIDCHRVEQKTRRGVGHTFEFPEPGSRQTAPAETDAVTA